MHNSNCRRIAIVEAGHMQHNLNQTDVVIKTVIALESLLINGKGKKRQTRHVNEKQQDVIPKQHPTRSLPNRPVLCSTDRTSHQSYEGLRAQSRAVKTEKLWIKSVCSETTTNLN